MSFQNKVVIIAGGTGGLGRATSLAFLDAGARVIATYRKQVEYEALASAAGSGKSRLSGGAVDVTDEPAVKQFVDGIVVQHGRIDALVNTVGGYAGGSNLWEADPR